MNIGKTLQAVGLNEKEARAYLTLLKEGRMTPAQLAKVERINRATTYSVAAALCAKGLIAEDRTGKALYLNPLPPQQLLQLIEKSKRELVKKEAVLQSVVGELSQRLSAREYPVPTMRFVQEHELEDYLYDNTKRWQRNALLHDGIWWGFQDAQFVHTYKAWIQSTWKTPESKEANFKAQVVTNAAAVEKTLAPLYPKKKRDVRIAPDMHFSSTVWVIGDSVVTILTKERPYYLFELQDPALASTMRAICAKLWKEATYLS